MQKKVAHDFRYDLRTLSHKPENELSYLMFHEIIKFLAIYLAISVSAVATIRAFSMLHVKHILGQQCHKKYYMTMCLTTKYISLKQFCCQIYKYQYQIIP